MSPTEAPVAATMASDTPWDLSGFLDGTPYPCSGSGTSFTGVGQSSLLGKIYPWQGSLEPIVQSAQEGFKRFRATSPSSRQAILTRLASLIEHQQDTLAQGIALEVGKPIKYARIEVQRAIQLCRAYADQVQEVYEQPSEISLSNTHQAQLGLRPLGPVLAYTPFNFPLNLLLHKLSPAIAAGTSIVIKPTPRAPLTAHRIVSLTIEAGYDAVSLVYLSDEQAGELIKNPVFRIFSFTGGTIGWELARKAPLTTRSILELGSNAPLILNDLPTSADLNTIAAQITASAFGFAGQSCISTQRIFVKDALFESFCKAFTGAMQAIKQGDILNDSTDLGPMISEAAAHGVQDKITEALSQGAAVLGGGPDNRLSQPGWLIPTALLNTTPEMAVNSTELFAPVVTITAYNDLDEAITLANRSPLGLHASIYTQSSELIEKARRDLTVRGLNVNEVPSFRDDRLPYGGVGDSGVGCEGVWTGIEDYSETIYTVTNTTLK